MNDSFSGSSASVESTSSGLLAGVQSQNVEAWRRLSKLYGPVVYRWARASGLQASDAADVVQEVFRALVGNVGKFHQRSEHDSFRGWLWTITRNKIHDHFRRGALRPAAEGGTDAYQNLQQLPALTDDSTGPPDADATAGIPLAALDLIRSEFEDRTWQAFWRLAIEAHQAADIAADLGMTKRAVRQAKYRVLRRLRAELVENDQNPMPKSQ